MRTLMTGISGLLIGAGLWEGSEPGYGCRSVLALATIAGHASPADDAKAVAALDTQYQAAVKANDAVTTRAGAPIDYKRWFSDAYVRTRDGWKYAFGQASIALPKAP